MQILGFHTVILLLAGVVSYSTARAKPLSFTKIQHSQVTVTKDVVGLWRSKGEILATPYFDNFMIKSQYNPNPGPQGYAFGNRDSDTAGAERILFPKSVVRGYWHWLAPFRDRFIMIEARKKRVAMVSVKDGRVTEYSDIILDLFKPASDSRGEPTGQETAAARKEFLKRLVDWGGDEPMISGLAPLPASWHRRQGYDSYLIATRLPGFSLLKMDCNRKDGLVCMITRNCFVEGLKTELKKQLSGLAISQHRKLLLMADRKNHRILGFRWDNCHHIPLQGEMKVPQKLQLVRGIHIDESDHLWLSTQGPDNYRNASVYKWKAEDWSIKN
ncbi:hypothetical protein [Pseudobacteriovorax antillogorgiicola]|uniref:Phytase-like domain-containing protein n=1 Tax=Pseudobacteriovorax antillogorgiicola TaxID=1513793 RepID=A0A1Y6BXS0_9BACT|nr:hypothetical protein [Pseudobacteriovorax antillogorgiicola]TCS50270.1 hypothetical protein EDD56_11388 [Pseudobacteriovorax antillogorgiicola]SMF33451.1 hypothetical protein SAMN06296036_11087 [Pseudobacteriovorax antillogorgiicola]